MQKSTLLGACGASALALVLVTPAAAQTAPGADAPTQVAPEPDTADVVVTGTLIRGTPEDAALPVDVIGYDELQRRGAPTALDLIKNLPSSNGVIGDANQFDSRSQGAEGVASVNLRGLGPQRTLVLLNGRRIVQAGTGIPVVDINLIPQAALGRIEVLKDGAAATYGSDAIAGVVNFITRSEQRGFQVEGTYRYIPGSDGDYTGGVSYGMKKGALQFLAAFGYQRRSELRTTERAFTVQPYQNNPQGGYTGGGSPGNFGFGGTLNFVRDLGCTNLGGFRSLPGSTTDRCFTNFGQFDNLVEPEDRYQAYLETKIEITDRLTANFSALYASSSTRITTSPSYLPTLPPSGYAASPLTTVPANNALTIQQAAGAGVFAVPTYAPALRDYCAFYGAAAGCVTNAAGQPLAPALAFPVLFRPFLLGGNPLFQQVPGNDRGSAFSQRQSELTRISGGLTGDIGPDLTLETGFVYSVYDRGIEGTDTFGDLLQNALAGFGGPNCPFATSASRAGLTQTQLAALAGTNGCTYFNPFSTAIPNNPVTGQVNANFAGTRAPAGFNLTPGAGLINDLPTIDNFFRTSRSDTRTSNLSADMVLSGKTPIRLPGGALSFAMGGQYRRDTYAVRYNADANLAVNPCPGSPVNPNAICAQQTGALGFLGTNRNTRFQGEIYALFGELQAPVTDRLNVQFSVRYEDYGGRVGSTFNPQGRVRWQVTPWLALRGGGGTTFRGPPPQNLDGQVTSLQVIGTSFRAIDILGNPNLNPESATTYGGGILINHSGLNISVDYFRYDVNGPIEAEPVAGIVNALFGASGNANCMTAGYERLRDRFNFSGGICGIGNVTRLRTFLQNNANVTTSGLDFQAEYKWRWGMFDLALGGNGTYVLEYKTGDVFVEGILVQPAFDAVGKLNFQTTAYPLPQVKGFAYFDVQRGPHSGRLQFNYIDGYTDQRTAAIFGPNTGALAGAAVTAGQNIGSFKTLDFTYRLALKETKSTFFVSFQNMLDEQPPFARLDFNYDPFTASPLGFNMRVGVTQRF
ncbi:MAG: hypothetical protein A4S12_07390 [Proteobacteria bacterium SG_bin5]|nr:MAG: hypothetical protein A4S12_07390 [Proteobacteria bacterium SG_bin5]